MKKAISIILIVCAIFLACGGVAFVKNISMGVFGLDAQENTTWVSEDGTITLHMNGVKESDTGTMIVDDKQIDFFLILNTGGIYIYPQEEGKNYVDDTFEQWTMAKKSDDSFTVKVAETTYFQKNQKITFYRVE